jgi:hypothetical protein
MYNSEWIERIEANRNELIEAIKAAYRGQVTTDPTSGYHVRVVLWDDGQISQQECTSSGEHYAAEREWRAICVATINGQQPDDWSEWVAEYGDEQRAAEAYLEMALTEWEWNPEQYIDETIEGLKYSE